MERCKEAFEMWYRLGVAMHMDIQTEVAWENWQAAWNAARNSLTDQELRVGVEFQRKEIDRLKQQLRDEGDRIAELKRAIEAMRVAGGSVEFQMAFDMAKALIVTHNAGDHAAPAGGRVD